MATGTQLTSDGTLHQTILGDGHVIIMDAGSDIIILDGAGFLADNGHLHGFHGVHLTTMLDGARYLLRLPGRAMSELVIGSMQDAT